MVPTHCSGVPRVSRHQTCVARECKTSERCASVSIPQPFALLPCHASRGQPARSLSMRTRPAPPTALRAPLFRHSPTSSPQTKRCGASDPTCTHMTSDEQRSWWLQSWRLPGFAAGLKPLATWTEAQGGTGARKRGACRARVWGQKASAQQGGAGTFDDSPWLLILSSQPC